MRWVLAGLLVMVGGCAAQLKLPPSLENATPLAVSGRAGERFTSGEMRFGRYVAYSIQRGYSSSFADREFWGNSIEMLRNYPEDDSYSFRFSAETSGENGWRGVCTTVPLQQGLAQQQPAHQLACTCVDPEGKVTISFDAASETDDLRGLLRFGDASYAIAGSREAAGEKGKRKRATGYVLSQKLRPLAAIDVLGGGTVWLVPGVSGTELDAVACVSVAMLLYH